MVKKTEILICEEPSVFHHAPLSRMGQNGNFPLPKESEQNRQHAYRFVNKQDTCFRALRIYIADDYRMAVTLAIDA